MFLFVALLCLFVCWFDKHFQLLCYRRQIFPGETTEWHSKLAFEGLHLGKLA